MCISIVNNVKKMINKSKHIQNNRKKSLVNYKLVKSS